MTTPESIKQLVQRFEEHRETYRSGKYNETQLRREFLDPFFEALGWDVFNKQGYAEMYKDVIHEDSLEIEGENKAPDYAFRIGGQRKFFVEAKKPAVKIETDIHPAFQLRRYAWSAKLPLSILSDFEELAIYDCRAKPDKKDKAAVGRVKFYSYKEYVEKWDEISSIFSREAVLRGSFDAFAEGTKLKKGTAEVDDAFLEEIERWRDLLATNIAIKNESLSVRELNYAVQMTIDRLVFLRICEDRGVERDEQLKEIGAGAGVYEALCQLFKRADARYNSGLFHFSEEKDASSPTDSLTLTIQIDDKPLKDIIKNLYYPESPYVFREIPADILGQVYERFLGKVIRLTAGHRAKVEEKPEVRKAGGVYYTPTYIVEYIVENTVGKLLEGKTPKEVEKIRVLDPACGSGTFPLGAYQYLIDWHLKWYMDNDPEKWATGKKPVIFQTKDGYRLTTSKKKDILLNNIYGVDIDPQAVEVTKLSLLLKVLEGESHETIGSQLALFQERVLPDLGKNIKCGNSLIGPDYYEGRQLTMLVDEEERYRVNAFDWKAEFSQVFIQGGFDAVIGNPPYVSVESTIKDVTEYYLKTYKTALGRANTFALFIEKSFNFLKDLGFFGMIVSNRLLTNSQLASLRKLILDNSSLRNILAFKKAVFGAAVDTSVIVFSKGKPNAQQVVEIWNDIIDLRVGDYKVNKISQSAFLSNDSFLLNVKQNEDFGSLISKIRNISVNLEKICDVKDGIILGEIKDLLLSDKEVDNRYEKWLEGNEVSRYKIDWTGRYICYDKSLVDEELKRKQLKAKKSAQTKSDFDKLSRSGVWLRTPEVYRQEKILTRQNAKRLIGVFDDGNNYFVKNSLHSTLLKDKAYNLRYILGILNSRLLDFYFQNSIGNTGEIFSQMKIAYIVKLPICPINFNDPADKARHDKLVSLVERMLALHKQSPRTPQEQEMVKREIESTDRGIDGLVYELYGLSEEEIRIVEGG